MELNISHLFADDSAFVPFDCSNNMATMGEGVGRITWQAAKETAEEITLLKTEEEKQEYRDYVKGFGAWSEEEIAAWSDTELNALLLQFIAGDVREAFKDADVSEWDWAQYEKDSQAGRISGNLFKADDGSIYYSIST